MFVIMHADLDSFYASVEQRDDPRLRGRPVLVGGGVVLAASYEAKAFGVRTPMSGSQARALCRDAVVVPPRMDAYIEASKAVFEIFRDTTPLVEGISVDEAFLDVTGLGKIRGTPVQVAQRLRREVKEKVGLPITVGIASTKFLAKVASAVGKPDGLLLVEPGRELEFLHPLKIERLWGVGKVTAEKLHAFDIVTVGDIAAQSEASIVSILGKGAGHHLYSLANNRDPRRVQTYRGRSSIGAQHALGRGPTSPKDVEASLIALVDRVTQRMRAAERTGRTVVLRLRFADFTKITRSHTLNRATADTRDILDAALALLRDAAPLIADQGITLVGVTVANIERTGAEQLELQFDAAPRSGVQDAPSASALDIALDGVHSKFGKKALTRGVLLGRDSGLSVPLLPD
ncbi:DNA polymerase IV [Rhodococcus sp. 14-2470-1b]|jgi:DNA polymerase-4|uniref:DNA polymerase IV n=1 Tax=unclassified Rhodococcus (in: high G+C Gram-positive bacteria) TaxID=192944 RepID=UPI000B9B6452|nr:DNA polymerase IV [Rhodococcus sp. 14-2470-1b]OZF50729.1 DNA polymerase IV [Rhodococcus sp. 14-2470-1b]